MEIERLYVIGKELGMTGAELKRWIDTEIVRERDQRAQHREDAKAQALEAEAQAEQERLRLEAEERVLKLKIELQERLLAYKAHRVTALRNSRLPGRLLSYSVLIS